ncbi:putative nucleoside diphosphate-linked moiety X motif 13 [Apostichopus japonicus]|uniref:Putative nucleoside diphosphate-linked moiety X motif 13 n=1 Tax=Stichopus japonicus TaxID=307972 RepID=A0A2G8K1G2_STIJA|nr:putative nucleoside diphosphate-linked moiety X motif 13 [Apostichopus japonicus]
MSERVDRLRFMQKLKEDESVCQKFISEGYFAVFCNLKPLIGEAGVLWKSYADIIKLLSSFSVDPMRDSIFVTVDEPEESPPKFAINISSDDKDQSKQLEAKVGRILGGRPCSVRKALFILPQDTASVVSTAYSLLQWHSKTQYCSCCGQTTTKDTSGFKRTCTSCSETFYPSIQPIAITLVTNGDQCVLARQPMFPPKMYSALAGFCETGESLP